MLISAHYFSIRRGSGCQVLINVFGDSVRQAAQEYCAPRVNAVKCTGNALDMSTTCGLLLALNEVSWDHIHMDFHLHKF